MKLRCKAAYAPGWGEGTNMTLQSVCRWVKNLSPLTAGVIIGSIVAAVCLIVAVFSPDAELRRAEMTAADISRAEAMQKRLTSAPTCTFLTAPDGWKAFVIDHVTVTNVPAMVVNESRPGVFGWDFAVYPLQGRSNVDYRSLLIRGVFLPGQEGYPTYSNQVCVGLNGKPLFHRLFP